MENFRSQNSNFIELDDLKETKNYNKQIFHKKDFFNSPIKKRLINDTLNEPLMLDNKDKIDSSKPAKSLFSFLYKEEEINHVQERKIFLNGTQEPNINMPNIVRNQKYTVLNLIPIVLYNQFKFFSNLFFLLIAVSQLFPPLRVGFLFTYVAPLAIVLFITIMKEAVDDFKRYQRDKEANSQKYKRITPQGLVDVLSSEIKVGDLIQISANERIPADMILLHTTDKSGSIFLRTDQLDGETDWKLRKPVVCTHEINDITRLFSETSYVYADPPNKQIYYFKGNFIMQQGTYTKKEPLCLEQTMWTNTVLASSIAVGVVIYTGKETRSQMNSSNPQTKIGAIDSELNLISKSLFTFMFICSVSIVALSGFNGSIEVNLINIFRFLLLLSSIIPISLRVNLDFAKIIYSYKISNDSNIPETIARNSTIPEELGRIQYLFTDKTGTLTQNEMVFKQICFESGNFTEEGLDELAFILKDECKKSSGPMKDVEDNYTSDQLTKKRARRNRSNVIRDAITALSICHNVTPVEENGEKIYQASSPDEVALVKIADNLKMVLSERSQMRIQIINSDDKPEDYEILANFPFSSETKRMGILVKHLESNRIVFYLKGAEVVMESKVQENSRPFLRETCENLASTGLRTLVISQKYVTHDEYSKWERKYSLAKTEMEDREKKVQKVIEELEEGMEFLCVTGVEDKLQIDVTDTIESLRNGGVQIWMLTGDKVETATCIAISTGLKSKSQNLFFMKELKTHDEVENLLKQFNQLDETILVIDGNSLNIALEEPTRMMFFKIASKSPAVVCCRCSPTQKTLVVNGMKHFTNTRTCSIGDGGNDVGMIQEAHIGVGIVGKEGKQASLAADFSINEFRSLKLLLLWHGRLSYKRSAVLSQFVIHRGLIISIIQVIFSILFYFTSIPIYNGYLMLGYATIFTSMPVFSIVFDEDVDLKTAIKFPILYKILQKGRVLNTKTFLFWCFKSIYQGSIIMIGCVVLFEKEYTEIVSQTFASLIFIEILNVYLEVHKLHIVMLFSFISTLGMYIACMIMMRNYLDVTYIFTWDTMSNIATIVILCWLPFFLGNMLYKKYFPEAHERV